MNNEESKISEFLKKLGISPSSLVHNKVVEFMVERYVNWTTETQRRFKKVMGVFLMSVSVSLVVLIYLSTFEKHEQIKSHNSIYQMLKKYVIKKQIYENRLSNLQAGRGGIIKGMNRSRILGLMKENDFSEEGSTVEGLETEKTTGFVKKNFSIKAEKITYPQMVRFLYSMETLGTNLHMTEFKVTGEGLEKGFYAMRFNISIVEPVAPPNLQP